MMLFSLIRRFTAALLTVCLIAGETGAAFANARQVPAGSAQVIYAGKSHTVAVFPGKGPRDLHVSVGTGADAVRWRGRIRRGGDRVYRSLVEKGGTIEVAGQVVTLTPDGRGGVRFESDNGNRGEVAAMNLGVAIAVVIVVVVVVTVVVPRVTEAMASANSDDGSGSIEVSEEGGDES